MIGTMRLRTLGVLAAATMLSGCVGSLLGGGKPDRLYRFGASAMAPTPVVPTVRPRRLLTVPAAQFASAVAGDRILTVDGAKAAYAKDARWLSPASVLYDDAVQAALRTRVPDIGIATRATLRDTTAILSIEIDRFEAQFADRGDASATPTVHIEGTATLVDTHTRAVIARYPIASMQTASADNEAAIVAAFDTAATRSAAAIADWVNVATPVPASLPTRR